MVNGKTTVLARANKTSQSLRTTVPKFIIDNFNLKEGDKLLWRIEARNNKLIVVVEPIKST
ncbi:MAG TPA: AbrB family transcriptional regulator [Thermococcus sp.]|nr:AbrB family transcriptional regulator [Thermococcus sp.]